MAITMAMAMTMTMPSKMPPEMGLFQQRCLGRIRFLQGSQSYLDEMIPKQALLVAKLVQVVSHKSIQFVVIGRFRNGAFFSHAPIEVPEERIEAMRGRGNGTLFVGIEIERDDGMDLVAATTAATTGTNELPVLGLFRHTARQETGAAFLVQFGRGPRLLLVFEEIFVRVATMCTSTSTSTSILPISRIVIADGSVVI